MFLTELITKWFDGRSKLPMLISKSVRALFKLEIAFNLSNDFYFPYLEVLRVEVFNSSCFRCCIIVDVHFSRSCHCVRVLWPRLRRCLLGSLPFFLVRSCCGSISHSA